MFFRLVTMLVAMFPGSMALAQGSSSGKEASIVEKRLDVDRTRWLFGCWAEVPWTTLQTGELKGKPTFEYVRKFVNEEQFKVLQDAYKKRKQAYDELAAEMDSYDVLLRRAEQIRQGLPEEVAARAYRTPKGFIQPSEDDIFAAFRFYVQAQDEAEEEWATVVDEVLTPEQFAKFAPFFTKAGAFYLRNPVFVKFLGLDDAQRRQVQKLTDLYQSKLKEATAKVGSQKVLDDPAVRHAYLKPFTALTPAQFKTLAPAVGLLKPGESWKEFRDRLRGDVPQDQTLGPLVDGILENQESK